MNRTTEPMQSNKLPTPRAAPDGAPDTAMPTCPTTSPSACAPRMQALASASGAIQTVQQTESATQILVHGASASLGGWGREGGNWWRAVMSAVPLAALVIGLFVVNMEQDDAVASEIGEVDAALLTGDLPPPPTPIRVLCNF